MKTVIKTVKQHSYPLEKDVLKELEFIGNQFKSVKKLCLLKIQWNKKYNTIKFTPKNKR